MAMIWEFQSAPSTAMGVARIERQRNAGTKARLSRISRKRPAIEPASAFNPGYYVYAA